MESKEKDERSTWPEAQGGERLCGAQMAADWPPGPVLESSRTLGYMSRPWALWLHFIFPTTHLLFFNLN